MARTEQDPWRERHIGTSMRARRMRPPMPGRLNARQAARQAWLARQHATDHDETMFLPTRPGGLEAAAPSRRGSGQGTGIATLLVLGVAAAALFVAAVAWVRG